MSAQKNEQKPCMSEVLVQHPVANHKQRTQFVDSNTLTLSKLTKIYYHH